ncbi:hypothetical protein ACQP2Y_21285 [Actinoplanes sp. CA-051413]|uniref:hypothetical protein n=1 Tax=Actinoplanes sp. CA-051413 TaxID=3239899 RepID=UPI003D9691A2
MTAVVNTTVCCEALFASDVQRSDEPSADKVREAVTATLDRLHEAGCAAVVAEEFGHHPDCAAQRMRWARQAVREAFARS